MQEKSGIFAKIFFMSVDELRNLIENKILYDIIQYCELNGKSPIEFINNTLRDNLTIMKYGDKPPMFNKIEKDKSFFENEEKNSDETMVNVNKEEENIEKKIILVNTPLEIPDNLPVFEEVEVKPKKRKLKTK